MSKFRKALCGVVAATVLAANSAMMTSAATTYDVCDVNHDGYVDLEDLVIVNKYLMGNYYFPYYNQLDATRSLTVDASDSALIAARNTGASFNSSYFSRETGGTVSNPTVSGTDLDAYFNQTSRRYYLEYSYSSHEEHEYSLKPPTSNSALINTREIVDGFDSRYAAYGEENDGIVKLIINGGGLGTGFIVGDHEIATAAHCVYQRNSANNGYWFSSMVINTYDSNGLPNDTTLTPVEAHIPKKYKTVSDGVSFGDYNEAPYDYAVITVEEDLSNHVQFSLSALYNVKDNKYSTIPLYVTGCPAQIHNESNANFRLYSDEGRVVNDFNSRVLHYNVDTKGGQSGSPVYTITRNVKNGVVSYIYTALAVHRGVTPYNSEYNNSNCGALMTKYQLQFYLNNNHLLPGINQ